MAETITAAELKLLLESSQLHSVLDVRDRGEFVLDHIPGVTPLPRRSLEAKVETVAPRKDIPLVLCCDTSERSLRAAMSLEAWGYKDVSVLEGGIWAWKNCGYETIAGSNIGGKEYGERIGVEKSVPEITVEELRQLYAGGRPMCVIDCRTNEEYLNGHLPGALLVPGGELPFEIDDLADHGKLVVVTCGGRTRSILSVYLIQRMGYRNALALDGGTGAWRMKGFADELESGRVNVKPEISERSRTNGIHFMERLAQGQCIAFISPEQLRRWSNEGKIVYLLDVRQPDEYEKGHLLGSIPCPAGEVVLNAERILGIRNAAIVTISNQRARAILSASILMGMGYPQVFVLDGGISSSAATGLPMQSGGHNYTRIIGLQAARDCTSFIEADDLQARMRNAKRTLLIDLRSIGEYGTGHIPGARWVSRGLIEMMIGKEAPEQTESLIIYCDSGIESILSVPTLRSLGYRELVVLEGGFARWAKKSLPIEQGLGKHAEFETVAIAECGNRNLGPYGFSPERMAKYLSEEKKLGEKYLFRK